MMKTYSVLIIDDVILMCDGYIAVLKVFSSINESFKFKTEVAHDCKSGYSEILKASKKDGFDIVFLDIRLPAYEEANILSGIDLGLKIRVLLPDTKIIVFTSFFDNYRLQNIFKSLNPEGILLKHDFDLEELVLAIGKILINDGVHYSKTVMNMLRLEKSLNQYQLDKYDRQILYELSKGTKIKDMPAKFLLAISTIEKRIYRLKEIFDAKNRSELICAAGEKGFI